MRKMEDYQSIEEEMSEVSGILAKGES